MGWRALRVKRGRGWSWNKAIREDTRGRAGAYAIREADGHRVVYVGESHTGGARAALRFWKTITRHFQDPTGKFKEQREVTFTSAHPQKYEVQVWVTGAGDAAMQKQAELIARLKPTKNVDDGRAIDTSFDFGANVENPAAPVDYADVDRRGGVARRLALQSFGGVGRLDVRMVPGPHGDEPVVREGARIVYSSVDADVAHWIVRALKVYRTLRAERGPELTDLELARALPRRRAGAVRWPDPPYVVSGGGDVWRGMVPFRVAGVDGTVADARTRAEADALVALMQLGNLGDAWRALGKRLTREDAASAFDAAEGGARAAFAELAGLLPHRPAKPERERRTGKYAHGLDAVCRCGRRKGEHDAEAPHAHEDGTCEGFAKASKSTRAPVTSPARPEGYGEESTHVGAAPGQTKMFNPSPKKLAADEYRDKHWGLDGLGVARDLDVVDPTHGVLVELGVLERVEYRTSKKGDPKGATYFHDFGRELPVLAFHSCDRRDCPDRGKLVIAGGSYLVKRHGIVG